MKNTYFILEDHSFMRYGISKWISENSHWECVGSADSISSTIEQLEVLSASENFPSILITDLNLGSETDDYVGLELISTITKKFPVIRVICYTMYKSPGIISDAINRGAKGFVCKNSGEKDLLLCMEKVAAGETYIEENLITSVKTYNDAVISLTDREKQVLNLILQKKSNDQIAEELKLQKRSVESYCTRIYDKLDCRDREKIIKDYSL